MAILEDPSTWPAYGQIDPQLEEMIQYGQAAFAKSPDLASIAPTREAWYPRYKTVADTALAAVNGRVTCRELAVPRRDGGSVRALVYAPVGESPPLLQHPLLVLFHGGGFCYGCPEMEGPTCVRAADTNGCVAISIGYRLAPESVFPAATDDCWDAVEWITAHAADLGVDLSAGFVLGGTSAGANIAAVLSLQLRDASKTPPLTGLYLNVPLLLDPAVVPAAVSALYRSRAQCSAAPVLNTPFLDLYTTAYAPNLQSPVWSPFNWPGGPHGLPPTYFQICGLDPLRDEGLLFARALRQAGIDTRVDLYPGLPHMFVPNFPAHPSCKLYPADTARGIRWLLGLQ